MVGRWRITPGRVQFSKVDLDDGGGSINCSKPVYGSMLKLG